MAFSLTNYIKKNLVNGYADGTWTESKVAQLSVGYLEKGLLTEEDIADIDAQIQSIKESSTTTETTETEVADDESVEESTEENSES